MILKMTFITFLDSSMNIVNNTNFTIEQINAMPLIGTTINKWRQRIIKLYQHPAYETIVISVGTSFDNTKQVIAEESQANYATALDYIKHGKTYTSE